MSQTATPHDAMAAVEVAEHNVPPLNLISLRRDLETVTKKLQASTAARTYLFRAFNDEIELPLLSLSAPGADVTIRMSRLNPPYAKAIIQVLLENQEEETMSAWQDAYEITGAAMRIVEQMRAGGEEAQPDIRTKEEKEAEERGDKLNNITRDLLEEVEKDATTLRSRGEPEPDQD